jgi:hypothetical protein
MGYWDADMAVASDSTAALDRAWLQIGAVGVGTLGEASGRRRTGQWRGLPNGGDDDFRPELSEWWRGGRGIRPGYGGSARGEATVSFGHGSGGGAAQTQETQWCGSNTGDGRNGAACRDGAFKARVRWVVLPWAANPGVARGGLAADKRAPHVSAFPFSEIPKIAFCTRKIDTR